MTYTPTPQENELARCIRDKTLGRNSHLWVKWWDRYIDAPGVLLTYCNAALLSLGPPPHPEYLTEATSTKYLDDCERLEKYLSRAEQRRRGRMRSDQVQVQWKYNGRFNAWANKHGLGWTEINRDSRLAAQFRKFFAAWLQHMAEENLHACKNEPNE